MFSFLFTILAVIIANVIFIAGGVVLLIARFGEGLENFIDGIEFFMQDLKWTLRFQQDRIKAMDRLYTFLDENLEELPDRQTKALSKTLAKQDIFFIRIAENDYILKDNHSWDEDSDDPLAFIWDD